MLAEGPTFYHKNAGPIESLFRDLSGWDIGGDRRQPMSGYNLPARNAIYQRFGDAVDGFAYFMRRLRSDERGRKQIVRAESARRRAGRGANVVLPQVHAGIELEPF